MAKKEPRVIERLIEFAQSLRGVAIPDTPLPCGSVLLRDPFGVGADVLSAE